MSSISEIYASMVFNDQVMREKLPKDVYKSLHKTIESGRELDITVANVVANAMKDWAIEKGATHYTHWFQPMTGITAEKHDSFISPVDGSVGSVIMEFSGKELIKGEPDASSFPSGGLRATFEARGYTAWDPTSYAFVKDGSLYIPTVFCSYGGEVLDKKTPLLRSVEAISCQALRVLRLFGNKTAKRVVTTVGPEQEYFLIDKALYDKRPDLRYCGRTLFGAKPPKGQEMDDHYFGAIKPRVASFMKELDEELWKLGVLAKTKHNEAAPAQHELAPIFSTTNIATDHNQLTMEAMKTIAAKHGLVCLLHEKPFAGVNGSGKHNNWSLSTDSGENLLDPCKTPYENAQFLLFLAAVIKAVDEYQDLLRVSVASAGNDHRLGANEAPPAIVSIFLGDELDAILASIESGNTYGGWEKSKLEIGVHSLPSFAKDTTDRNRTSPFAFTGNKFEFRMLGSSASISGANIALNTAVAEELKQFADSLEKAKDQEEFTLILHEIIKDTVRKHKRIIFNGDGYSEAWEKEAEQRGLCNYKTTVDALPSYISDKNIGLFTSHRIFTETEVHSRYEIRLETYCKTLNIEAQTMVEMAKRDLLPAITGYTKKVVDMIVSKRSVSENFDCSAEVLVAEKLSCASGNMIKAIEHLEVCAEKAKLINEVYEKAKFYRDEVLPAMAELRTIADNAEPYVASNDWPYPSYGELLFMV